MPMVVSARTRVPPMAIPIMVDELIPALEKIGIEELLGLSNEDVASDVS